MYNRQEIEKSQVSIPLHSPSWKEMTFFFFSGVIIGIPVNIYFHDALLDMVIGSSPFYLLLISELLISPFVEEFSKVFGLIYRHGETEQTFFKLAVLSGFGFGIGEFLILTFTSGSPFIISIPGIFFHLTATGITAYGIAINQAFRYYLLAVFLHFLHNLFLFFSPSILFGLSTSTAIVVITYFIARKLQNLTKNQFVG